MDEGELQGSVQPVHRLRTQQAGKHRQGLIVQICTMMKTEATNYDMHVFVNGTGRTRIAWSHHHLSFPRLQKAHQMTAAWVYQN